MAEYWPDSYLLFRGLDFVSVRKNAKRRRPISSHFDLTLSHCYYATLKISLRELPYGMLIVSLWVFGMESHYIRDFKIQRRDGDKNVAKKVNLRSFSLYSDYS